MSEWVTTDTPHGKELLTSLKPGDRIELWRRGAVPLECVVEVSPLGGLQALIPPTMRPFFLDIRADACFRYRIRRTTT